MSIALALNPAAAPALGSTAAMVRLHAWRHPKAKGAAGRCVGQTDLPVDARKAKRVARRIQAFAKRHGSPKVIHTSDLQRSRRVGQWLARWGWQHIVCTALREVDFGAWDGRRWADIAWQEVEAWANDLAHVRPGGGESVAMLLVRVADAVRTLPQGALLVSHGGWMCAARWLAQQGWPEADAGNGIEPALPHSMNWPRAPRNGELWWL